MATVNHIVSTLAGVAVLVVLGVLCGSWLLRWSGIASMVVSITFLLVLAGQGTATLGTYLVFIPMALFGFTCWIVAHRIYLAQRGHWRSGLAARIWQTPRRAGLARR